jgi:hypothetical protein
MSPFHNPGTPKAGLLAQSHRVHPNESVSGCCNRPRPNRHSGCASGKVSTSGIVSGTCKGTAKPSRQTVFLGNPADGVRDISDVSLFAANGVWGHYYVYCCTNTDGGGVACTGAPTPVGYQRCVVDLDLQLRAGLWHDDRLGFRYGSWYGQCGQPGERLAMTIA